MTGPEQLFWGEVANPGATRRSLAVCYALLIAVEASRRSMGDKAGAAFWQPVNEAVKTRLALDTFNKVDSFRKLAWAIHGAAAEVTEAGSLALSAPHEGVLETPNTHKD